LDLVDKFCAVFVDLFELFSGDIGAVGLLTDASLYLSIEGLELFGLGGDHTGKVFQ
jgi:hypothetical protein